MNDDFHDDEFFEGFEQTARRWAVLNAILGFTFFVLVFLLIATTIYFFLAAAGVVPEMNVVPFIPYV